MKKILSLLLALLSCLALPVFAGGPTSVVIAGPAGLRKHTQTTIYAGLTWTLTDRKPLSRPDLIVGVRSVKVQSNDRISSGADASVRFAFDDGLKFDSTRISVLQGDRDLLRNLGVGYSRTAQSVLFTAAVQVAYARLGTDVELSNAKLLPYFELLTLDKPDKVRALPGFACSGPGTLPPNPVPGAPCL